MCLVFPDGICLKRFATRGHLIEIFSVLPTFTPRGKRALTMIFWPLTEVNVLETGGEDWFSALPQNSESVGRGDGVENSISESSGDSGRNVSVFVDVGEFVWYPWSSRSSSSFSFASLEESLNFSNYKKNLPSTKDAEGIFRRCHSWPVPAKARKLWMLLRRRASTSPFVPIHLAVYLKHIEASFSTLLDQICRRLRYTFLDALPRPKRKF